jgi:hypothetical protein
MASAVLMSMLRMRAWAVTSHRQIAASVLGDVGSIPPDETDCGNVDQRLGSLYTILIILAQSSGSAKPSYAPQSRSAL